MFDRTELEMTVDQLNQVKNRSERMAFALRMLRAVAISAMAVSLWSLVRPTEAVEQLAVAMAALILAIITQRQGKRHEITAKDFVLSLEIEYPDAKNSAVSLTQAGPSPEWQQRLQERIKSFAGWERKRLLRLASTLVIPLLISFVTLPQTAPSITNALAGVQDVVNLLNRGASLRVLRGGAEGMENGTVIKLVSGETKDIELLTENMVELRLTGFDETTSPIVQLHEPRKEGQTELGPAYQSFQFLPNQTEETKGSHSITFGIPDDVELVVPAVNARVPLVRVNVQKLPLPEVTLKVAIPYEEPWPDDQPLPLKITVEAKNPLDKVRLLIRSKQRLSEELVANVMTEDKLELATDYSLILEPYVDSDLAEVEIVAEAIDRAVPTPLSGRSKPITIQTASAYGRYRQTLNTLRQLKSQVDEGIKEGEKKLSEEALELANKASQQSERSPFFDGLDRVNIHRFEDSVRKFQNQGKQETLLEVSDELNEFLLEHEILDDRERDRDFFVAARGLSRLVEQERNRRPVAVPAITDRMKKFLDDREERWKIRVNRLPPADRPLEWNHVEANRPFHNAMNTIAQLDQQATPEAQADQLQALSQAVVEFRTWIEALESAEDKMRQQMEQERRQGLASAQNQLRELQQRQGQVSAALDRADRRPNDELQGSWPSTRMKQNQNAEATKRLENQMRSLSPTAGARIQAAQQAMELTLEAGNKGQFKSAEEGSDFAARMLRQAQQAASQSQQRRRSRGRRRRVTGDNYYGQSVVGGDVEIKREYQVDRRYREDILDEVQSSSYDSENRRLMENYLRQIVR